MLVTTFLLQVYIGLIADKQLMTAVARIDSRGVNLIAIANVYAMKTAANEEGNRIARAVGGSSIKLVLVILIDHSGGYIATPAHSVITN